MRITERRLRSIIRNVIRESMHDDDEGYPSDDPRFAPFENDMDDDLYDDMEVIDADEISMLDQPAHQRGTRRDGTAAESEIRRFMKQNRRAAAERDRGSYETRGHAHSDQIDMLDDMGELNRAYDDDGEEYEQ